MVQFSIFLKRWQAGQSSQSFKMSVAQLSQKEYLKKYLSSNTDDKKKKKKKKVQKNAQERFRIVDDDIDLKNMRPIDDGELDLYNLAEDAPQIAGIIDERPHEAQMLEEFRGSKRWKIIADENGTDEIKVTAIEGTSKKSLDSTEDAENSSSKTAKPRNPDNSSQRKSKKDCDSDVSPPRKSRIGSDSDPSPLRKAKRGSDSDVSPPKKSRNVADSDVSPPRKHRRGSDSDISPPRRSRRDSAEKIIARKPSNTSNADLSPPRKSRNVSPPRNARKDTDSDISPPRKRARHSSSDISPPRKPKGSLPAGKIRGQRDISPHRRKRSSSPQRNRHDSDDINKHKKSETFVGKKANSMRHSPVSRRKHSDSDNSPPRRTSRKSVTPPRKQKPGIQPSNHSRSRRNGRSSSDNSPLRKGRIDKTLDGKRAGLQDANELKQELSDFKKREDELFSKMGDEVSGRGVAAVVRDRKTGKRRDLEQEAKQNEEEQRKKDIRNEKYSKWGRGLKQVEAQKENLEQALHEMSKPLARYADDQDLEKHLRDQEREGDPMLDYIRSKKTEDTTKRKPKYEGSYLPNRFGIPPGHRWDGADRSNGYEKQWFEVQNAKKAREEEAYKWSTSDM